MLELAPAPAGQPLRVQSLNFLVSPLGIVVALITIVIIRTLVRQWEDRAAGGARRSAKLVDAKAALKEFGLLAAVGCAAFMALGVFGGYPYNFDVWFTCVVVLPAGVMAGRRWWARFGRAEGCRGNSTK